jgi:two-component system, NtrC family, nitrogen regulation sensor histidine kinase NtrY
MKKKKQHLSIRAKLAGTLVLVCVALMGAVLVMLNARLKTSFDELGRTRVKSAIDGIRSEYEALVQNTRDRVVTIATDRFVVDETAAYSSYPGDLIRRIEAIRKTSGLDILKVVDQNSILIADGANPATFGISYADDPFIKQALESGETRVSLRRDKGPDRENVSIVVYYPIIYMGQPIAVLLGGMHMDQDYVGKLQRLASARVVLFEGYHAVVSSNKLDPETSLPVGRDFLNRLLKHPAILDRISSGKMEFMVGGVPLTAPKTGDVLGFLVIGVSRGTVNNIIAQTRNDTLYVLLIGIAISLLVAVIMSVSITRPISRLVRAARLIGRGEFTGAEIPVRSHDELGLLADTMNRMAKDLREYSERLALSERIAAWREIARRIAHEIKNPLSPIQLSIENLKAMFEDDRAGFDEMFVESADTVLEEVDKLRRLANEFSEFAQMPRPQFEDVDIGEMLANLARFHAGSAPPHVTISFERDDSPLMVRADRDQMNRVFTNLIKNAVEAMPDGGSLRVIAGAAGGEVFTIFEDSGVGIPTEDIEKIFTPYYTSKSGGTGLGLAIVRRILRDHNATIDVRSEQGSGTKFVIAFKALGTAPAAGGQQDV